MRNISLPTRDVVSYKEVEVVEEKIIEVPRKEIVTTTRIVPKISTEIRETVVEIPRIEVVQKDVEVIRVEEVVRQIERIERVEVPRETIRYVPKIEVRQVEKEVEVQGDLIEVPKEVEILNHVVVRKYNDHDEDVVVAQKMIPILNQKAEETFEVKAREYIPKIVSVDVFVPKPVYRCPALGQKEERYEGVVIPPAHYNALVVASNQGLPDEALQTLLDLNADGSFRMSVSNGVGESIQTIV
eukprot:GHVH01007563.1.p1 GENE.GHVH01007563.1~~GHVH01007563.1.p1  ORF type:complete len:242 (-),score=30.92 GHVH01007563.1:62-787(-)